MKNAQYILTYDSETKTWVAEYDGRSKMSSVGVGKDPTEAVSKLLDLLNVAFAAKLQKMANDRP